MTKRDLSKKPLQLTHETIRTLQRAELTTVVGGVKTGHRTCAETTCGAACPIDA